MDGTEASRIISLALTLAAVGKSYIRYLHFALILDKPDSFDNLGVHALRNYVAPSIESERRRNGCGSDGGEHDGLDVHVVDIGKTWM